MNERIRELAEQAWDATAVSPDFGHPVSFAEKLSELIVRECIDIAPWMYEAKIKEHFGVKE